MSTVTPSEGDDVKTVWGAAARWLFGQEANTVMMFVLVGLLAAGGYYAVTTAIPSHLASIQAGYERIDKAHNQQTTEARTAFKDLAAQQTDALIKQGQVFKDSIDRVTTSFDKAMEREHHK